MTPLNARRATFRRKAEREVRKAGEALARLRLLAQSYRTHYEPSDSTAILTALTADLGALEDELTKQKPVPMEVEW